MNQPQGNISSSAPNVLSETLFDDFLVPGVFLTKGAGDSPALKPFRGNLQQNAYSGTGPLEEAFFAVHLLHGLKANSIVTFHAHWAHIIAIPTGNVKWIVDVSFARGYEAGVFPEEVVMSSVQAAGAQYAHHITDDDDMSISPSVELEPDSIILGRICRDPADAQDTFDNDAFLLHIDLHYQRSHIGTTERNREFKSSGY